MTTVSLMSLTRTSDCSAHALFQYFRVMIVLLAINKAQHIIPRDLTYVFMVYTFVKEVQMLVYNVVHS